MNLDEFDFDLPEDLIAQTPAARRDQSRLMIVIRAEQRISHDVFANIGAYLDPGDVLVLNDTKVIPARLRGRKVATGGKVELLLLHDSGDGVWEVLLRPAARSRLGTVVEVDQEGALRAEIVKRVSDTTFQVRFSPPDIYELLEQLGDVPLPPYIKRTADDRRDEVDRERYQTVYAVHPGAVAAPTAGLHFTPELLHALEQKGLRRATVTLHVGWGTFQPVRVTNVHEHRMAKEFYRVEAAQAGVIQQTRAAGGRVVAIGTTATRTLETVAQRTGGIMEHRGWSDLFIYPSYQFQIVDTLLTNFHLPRSTLFLLVCAFAGHSLMRKAYHCAIAEHYRFYSYGDAMLIQ